MEAAEAAFSEDGSSDDENDDPHWTPRSGNDAVQCSNTGDDGTAAETELGKATRLHSDLQRGMGPLTCSSGGDQFSGGDQSSMFLNRM